VRVFSAQGVSDQQPKQGKPNRDSDPAARRPRDWVDTEMVVILGAIAVLMAVAVLTGHTYSLLLNTVPTISTAASATTGESDDGPRQRHSGHQRSIERYPATLRARERPGSARTP
jgi:hypothetical protein